MSLKGVAFLAFLHPGNSKKKCDVYQAINAKMLSWRCKSVFILRSVSLILGA